MEKIIFSIIEFYKTDCPKCKYFRKNVCKTGAIDVIHCIKMKKIETGE
jgi:hypothetical protein